MPFFRQRRRRFSATPRRRWSRKRPTGQFSPRMQVAQFSVIGEITADETEATDDDPAFLFMPLSPWDNAPQGGYDRSFDIVGLHLDLRLRTDSVSSTANGGGLITHGGVFRSTQEGPPALFKVCGCVFADTVDPTDGSPVSLLGSGTTPVGPFVTTPPVADPSVAPSDDTLMPVRYIQRKYGFQQWTSNHSTTPAPAASAQDELNVINNATFRWSTRIRKRISVDSRQNAFVGFFLAYDFSPAVTTDVVLSAYITGNYYYRLRR